MRRKCVYCPSVREKNNQWLAAVSAHSCSLTKSYYCESICRLKSRNGNFIDFSIIYFLYQDINFFRGIIKAGLDFTSCLTLLHQTNSSLTNIFSSLFRTNSHSFTVLNARSQQQLFTRNISSRDRPQSVCFTRFPRRTSGYIHRPRGPCHPNMSGSPCPQSLLPVQWRGSDFRLWRGSRGRKGHEVQKIKYWGQSIRCYGRPRKI